MKIVVLGGSPKGDESATMQYVHYIQRQFPQHDLEIIQVSQRIRKIETVEGAFDEIVNAIRSADGVLWAFPVYFLAVPYGYKRFIELVFERGVAEDFAGKYAAVLTTSIHFFDHTAHNYMRAVCDDLGMAFGGSCSAEMYDLVSEAGRETTKQFARNFFDAIENEYPAARAFQPVVPTALEYVPDVEKAPVDPWDRKILVLTDSVDESTNLGRMVERFRSAFSEGVEVIDLNGVDIKGGCLGCIQCGYANECAYGDRDEFVDFYNSKVKTADIVVFAGHIVDRYLSSLWKMYFDRSFFNNHTPSLMNKQTAFIISGPLGQNANLRQILQGYIECQIANIVDFVTDEATDSAALDATLHSLAERLVQCSRREVLMPATFLGFGGIKVFRDDIWGRLRFPFLADHKFYKANGVYDFPQKDVKARLQNALLILLTKIPSMRKELYTKRIKAEMIKPLQKALEAGD
ncbi:NAD(P)H-dependent oxidoreductase [Thermodesulfobacteriota bacterium]